MSPPLQASPLYLREAEVRRGIEYLFLGASALVDTANAELHASGLGRAHHRVLYCIARRPGLTVGQLLAMLGITKQSLGRVLSELAAQGLIVSGANDEDRRQRLLRLTPEGVTLERALFGAVRQRLAHAYERAGQDAVTGFWRVLEGLLSVEDRGLLTALDQS